MRHSNSEKIKKIKLDDEKEDISFFIEYNNEKPLHNESKTPKELISNNILSINEVKKKDESQYVIIGNYLNDEDFLLVNKCLKKLYI